MVITGHWHQFTLMAFPVSLSIQCTKCLTLSLSLWSQCCVYSYLTPPGTSGSAKSADSEICQDTTMGQSAKCLRWTRSYQRLQEGNFFHSSPPHLRQTSPRPKKKSFKVLKDTEGKLCNSDLKNRSKPQVSMVRFVFHYQIKETSGATKREKKETFQYERGLGSSYYLNCGSCKRLYHPLKEELQLFSLLPKNKHFGGDAGAPPAPREVGRGQERLAASQPPWPSRWATSLPSY